MDVFLSDFDSYSESSSSDDQEDDEFMYSGQATSILSNLQETIGKIDDFLLFERRYVHGDVVYSGKDRDSQMGKVTNVEMVVDLENINEKKLKDISSKKLARIRSISTGEFVILGPWVGKAEHITDSVTVLFDDGTKCEFTVTGLDTEKLVPIWPDLMDDSQYPYYPGQRVKAVNLTQSKSSQWFCGSKNQNQDEGTVCSVDSGLVHVNWLGCALLGSDSIPAPPSLQNSKDLTLISGFSHSNWQIGDWCMLPKLKQSRVTDHPVHKQSNICLSFQEMFVIAKMTCKLDVLWQDGSESCGLYASSLYAVNTLDAHDFWPHQFVMEKGTSDDQQDRKSGVVKAVDANEKTAKVKWESGTEETVSVYELIEHPDYSYNQGDLVFRLNKGQDVQDGEKCSNNLYLDHIGIVVGLKNGLVEVKWAAGYTSKVAPHEVLRVEKSESLSTNGSIQQDQEKPELSPDPIDKSFSDSVDDGECLKTLYESTTFNVPRAAIGFLSNVAKNLLGFPFYSSLSDAPDNVTENRSVSGFDAEDDQVFVETSSDVEVKESKDEPSLSSSRTLNEIKQFDMVNDCSNHHFVDSPGKNSISSQVKKCWLKKVQQEWSILANGLPDTIYVRVFEERMDLIRAAIVGAPGTPYHDCLFFFDIYLPPEYPHEPPMVHYDSGGLRVNPNLYESGRVCLSLLKTWTGTGTETWNPNGSTILQVLLSLQALVLNKNPYFNEAGYDQQVGSPEGEKNSGSYNENAFLMSCKSMLYILRHPPKHFEALVEEHFSKHCRHILMACKAYLEGVPVGCSSGAPYLEPDGLTANSTGFKIMLSKLVPKLVETFTAKGFDCGEFSKGG